MERADFGKTADDYAKHRAGFPASFFDEVFKRGWIETSNRLLDLGTGTGTLSRGLAERGCRVVGLDISPLMLDQAARLAREAGLSITFVEAPAEETGQASGSFDTVIAGQCWHWFDKPRAAREARRVLIPGGRLIIAHFDWLPLPGSVVAATEKLIEAHNPKWDMGGTGGRYPQWAEAIGEAGFTGIEIFDYTVEVPYARAAWRGRIRASSGVGGSLDAEAVTRFDEEHGMLLARDFPADPLAIPHRVWALSAQAPR